MLNGKLKVELKRFEDICGNREYSWSCKGSIGSKRKERIANYGRLTKLTNWEKKKRHYIWSGWTQNQKNEITLEKKNEVKSAEKNRTRNVQYLYWRKMKYRGTEIHKKQQRKGK